MYRDILVSTDGSELSMRAAEQGLAIARELGATVHVLSVVDVRDGLGRKDAREQARAECQSFTKTIADEVRADDGSVVTSVRDGHPHHELLGYADEHEIDLIVVGTHGRTGVRRWVLGSVATSVIRDSQLPVLTVGKNATDLPRQFDEILVTTDGRPGASAAVEHGIGLAEETDATLHCLYVVDDTHSRTAVVIDAFEEVGEMATTDIAVQASERGVGTVRALEYGLPSEAIVEYADDHGIDFIVMGTESRTGLERVAFGSVSQRVVAAATAPVLTVRATDSRS